MILAPFFNDFRVLKFREALKSMSETLHTLLIESSKIMQPFSLEDEEYEISLNVPMISKIKLSGSVSSEQVFICFVNQFRYGAHAGRTGQNLQFSSDGCACFCNDFIELSMSSIFAIFKWSSCDSFKSLRESFSIKSNLNSS